MQPNATLPRHPEANAWKEVAAHPHAGTSQMLDALIELAARPDLGAAARTALTEAIGTLHTRESSALAAANHQHNAFEAVPDAITVHDENGDIVDANSAACRLYGRTHAVLLTLNLLDLSPGLPTDHIHHVIETCRSGKTFTMETTIRRGDDREFPVEVHLSVSIDGTRQRVLMLARGISHWKRVADELHDAEQRHRVLLQSMDKGVMIRDANSGRTVYHNPAAQRIFQLSESEISYLDSQGFPGWRYTDAAGQPLAVEDLPATRALRTGVAIESQMLCFWLPHLKRSIWVLGTAVPLYRRGETAPYQAVSTFTDITELKRMRDVLEQTQAAGNIGGYEYIFESGELIWTEQMYRLFDLPGTTPITLERALLLLEPHSRNAVPQNMEAIRDGATVKNEHEIITALGRRRWISTMSQPMWRGNAVCGISGMCQDITERKILERELRSKAVTDSLTGLANRESILEKLGRQIISTRDRLGPVLMYIDLDRFKVINDVLGAAAGDDLLASAARRLQDCLPDGARCGRFAGDEFLVVLPRSMRETQPAEIAEMINAKFRRPFEYANEEVVITASIGIARYPDDGTTAQQLLHHADAAMSEAKRRGRSTWQAFSPALARRLQNNFAIESQLRSALANRELQLVYQPTVELEQGTIIAVESLLRWNHPVLGELQPLAFVQHAESSGEIVAIGAWVIDESCRQLRQWQDAGLPLARIAVNVSYRQLLSDSFLETVLSTLRRHGLPGSSLELEIIERMLIEDTPDTVQMFKDLRSNGVSITIDDFGEGYSALNYLRRLPIDGFKISYDFMRRVPLNPADTAICEAIIRVGHGLGLNMIAEGVETEEQRQFLLSHGMKFGQGHLFSAALRADAVEALLRTHGPVAP